MNMLRRVTSLTVISKFQSKKFKFLRDQWIHYFYNYILKWITIALDNLTSREKLSSVTCMNYASWLNLHVFACFPLFCFCLSWECKNSCTAMETWPLETLPYSILTAPLAYTFEAYPCSLRDWNLSSLSECFAQYNISQYECSSPIWSPGSKPHWSHCNLLLSRSA